MSVQTKYGVESTKVEVLQDLIYNFLDRKEIKENPSLFETFEKKIQELVKVPQSNTLTPKDQDFYNWTQQLFDSQNKIRNYVATKLQGLGTPVVSNQSALNSPSNTLGVVRNWKVEPSIQTLDVAETINCFIELKDGTLAYGRWGTIKLLDSKGNCFQTLKGDKGIEKLIERQNGTLASSSYDATILLWDRNKGCIQTLSGHTKPVRILVDLKDGTLASLSNCGEIKLWDQKGDCIQTIPQKNVVSSLIELNNEMLALCGVEDKIEIVDRKGNCIRTLSGNYSSVLQLKSGMLVSSSREGLHLLDIKKGGCIQTFPIKVSGNIIEIEENILACLASETVEIWDIQKNSHIQTILVGKGCSSLIKLRDGRLVVEFSSYYNIKMIKFLTFPS